MSKAKYEKGNEINNINDLINQENIYLLDKIINKGFFLMWQIKFTKDLIDNKKLFYAVKKSDMIKR